MSIASSAQGSSSERARRPTAAGSGSCVTPVGERLLRRIRTRRTTWLAERLEQLEPDELETISAALPALRRLVELPE